MLAVLDLLGIACDEDAPSLAAAIWLADVSPVLSHAPIGLEVPIAIKGQHRSWHMEDSTKGALSQGSGRNCSSE